MVTGTVAEPWPRQWLAPDLVPGEGSVAAATAQHLAEQAGGVVIGVLYLVPHCAPKMGSVR